MGDADGDGEADKALSKHIRVLIEQWERIEQASRETALATDQIVLELATETLDRRQWPRSEANIKIARVALFSVQAIARDLIAAGREHEVEEIRDFISATVPGVEAWLPTTQPQGEQVHRWVDWVRAWLAGHREMAPALADAAGKMQVVLADQAVLALLMAAKKRGILAVSRVLARIVPFPIVRSYWSSRTVGYRSCAPAGGRISVLCRSEIRA